MNAIEEKIKELEIAVDCGDWERMHVIYDEILYMLARKYDDSLMDRIDDITEDSTFWYA